MDDYAANHEDWPEPEPIDEVLYHLSMEIYEAEHKLRMTQVAYKIGASDKEDVRAALAFVRGLRRAHFVVWDAMVDEEEF